MLRFLATGFYVGLIPRAPGTFGTLVGLPLVWALQFVPPWVSMSLTLAAVFVAIVICDLYERQSGHHDQSEVVLDEIVGLMVTMLWLPVTPLFLLAGFLLFRLLDIVKPYPIHLIDERMKGGMGVVLDDIAAALVANFILQVIYLKTSWLGVQWAP